MQPATLHCPSCGAAVSSDATQCQYCQAKLATVACPSCFGLAFIGSKFCPHCGAELAKSHDDTPVKVKCPRCNLPLERRSLGKTTFRECAKCGGLWIASTDFERICADQQEQTAVLGDVLGPLPRVTIEISPRYLPCPQCGNLMNRLNFAHSSGVIVDMCKPHGIWFDRDELRKIIEFIRAGGVNRARALELQKLQDAQRRAATASTLSNGTGPGALLSQDVYYHPGAGLTGLVIQWLLKGL